MSDYKLVNGKKVRVCRYGCSVELPSFDTTENKYGEVDGTLHTKQRCENLKVSQKSDEANQNGIPNGHNELSLEVVLKKLESIGITLDLTKLRNAVNGDTK